MAICKRKQKWRKIRIKLILGPRREKLIYWRYQEHDTQFVAAGRNVSKIKFQQRRWHGIRGKAFVSQHGAIIRNFRTTLTSEWMQISSLRKVFLKNLKSLRSQLLLLRAMKCFILTQRSHLRISPKKIIYVLPTVLRGCENYCVCCFSVQITNKNK